MSKARVFQSLVFSAALWAVEAHAATAPPPPKQPCAWEPKFGTWMLQRTPTDPAGGSPNDINRNLGQTVTLSVQSIQRRFVNDGDEMWSFGGSAVSNTGATGRVEGQLYRHKEKRYWQPDTLIHWNNGYRDDHVFDVNSVNDGTIDGYYYGLDVLQNTPPPILHITTFYWFEGQNEADNTKLALAGGAGGRSRLSLPFQCKPPASPQDPIDSPFFKPTGAGIEPAKPHVNPADPAFRFFPPVRSGSSPPPSQPPPPQPAPPAAAMTGTFDTDLGVLVLAGNGGSYSTLNGRVTVTGIAGNVMDGTWTTSWSTQLCADGTYRGRFRFTFNALGFTGAYGFCDGPLTAGPWNGRRR